MKVEIIEEDAAYLLAAMAGDPNADVEVSEVEVIMPSSSTPAVSGESSPTQDSGDTEQQR